VIKQHAYMLLGRQETQQLIDHLKEDYPILVEEVTPDPLKIGDIQKVLANLLKENVSIRNLPVIFEALADYGVMTNDPDLLTEYVRQSLSPQITKQYAPEEGSLKVVTVSGWVEKKIAENIQQTEHGAYLSLDPESQQSIIQTMHEQLEKLTLQEETAIVLCTPAVRMHVKQLIDRYLPHVVVLSYNELEPTIQVESIGVVNAA